ncbi:hypothetical protein [Atlantibacter sp.]|uniref:hypothetical protein n=1 Tax=Atlantibacter sp. TaxID=1903473 RepID=UPI0028A98BA0|nr:hypothetical protein [Atlantibacter sp.]
MDVSRRSLLAIGGAGLIGAAIPTTYSQLTNSAPLEWLVGDHGGEYGPEKDISDAFNRTIQAKGDVPGRVIVPYVNGVLYVDKSSLIIPDNIEIDFCNNVIKLQDHASKYLLTNLKNNNDISGKVVIKNAIFDGNKRGGQTRRFDRVAKDDTYGDIYDYKYNYPGFCLVFDRIEELVVENIKIIDAEGWGIAHFLCDNVRFSNIEITSQNGIGLNGDGITGVGTRYVHIQNIQGYTNDDMIGISTSRATVQGISVFNPSQGRNVENVTIENLRSVKNDQSWSFVGVGLYFSDDKIIKNIDINGVFGVYHQNILRIGNYWSATASCGIDNITLENIHSSTLAPASADISLFSGQINTLSVTKSQITRLMADSANYFNMENAVVSVEGAKISTLIISGFEYHSDFLSVDPSDTNAIVVCKNNGEIENITFDIRIVADKTNGYTLLNKADTSTVVTKLNIASFLPNNEVVTFHNITNAKKYAIGARFNVKVSEPLSGESIITRTGSDAWIDGVFDLTDGISHVPLWCAPTQPKITSCYDADAPNNRYVARIDTNGLFMILQKPRNVKKIYLDGAGWKCA